MNSNTSQLDDVNNKQFITQTLKEQQQNEILKNFQRKKLNYEHELEFYMLDCSIKNQTNKINLFGVTENGQSIEITVKDYFPYFYFLCPPHLTNENDVEIFRQKLNNFLNKSCSLDYIESIIKLEKVQKENIRNFKGNTNFLTSYLKCYFNSTKIMKIISQLFQRGFSFDGYEISKQTFESKITYPLKFLIDNDLTGMGWIKVTNLPSQQQESFCTLSYEVKQIDLQSQINKIKPPKLRILCIDVQSFIQNENQDDSQFEILMISCTFNETINENLQQIVFTQRECQQISNCIIIQSTNETQLLKDFHNFFKIWDPDVLTGYNIHDETFPYIIQRSKILNLEKEYLNFGRSLNEESAVTNGVFFSTVMRLRETKNVIMNGRIQLDTLISMLRDTKISQYSLGNIYYSIFHKQIEVYDKQTIHQLVQNGNIKRIANYSLHNSNICLEIFYQKGWLVTYSEVSKVTGVPINFIIMRGQSVKVLSQILREAKAFNYILPDEFNLRSANTSNLKGALVLPPIKGFYKVPLALFDFVSLYPSIVIAYNMCYTTILKNYSSDINENDYYQVPEIGIRFVKQHIRKGILPIILEKLLQKRAEVKLQLKKEQDKNLVEQLDSKQYALKIAANSIFGFTGCSDHGYLPCLEITQSIMLIGRLTLRNSIDIIKTNYPNAEILYGDTDSLLINFNKSNLKESFENAEQVAKLVTSNCQYPIRLAFEKIFNPFILICKKRYVGLSWKNSEQMDKIEQKGICTVRRDNCLFLRKVLQKVLELLLIDKNINQSISFVNDAIQKLVNDQVNFSDLIITKSLSIKVKANEQIDDNLQDEQNFHSYPDKYHDPQNSRKQPHLKVANDKIKNSQVNQFQKGDRISYVIVENNHDKFLSEQAEDPFYAFSNNIRLDKQYYINQIKLPIIHLLENIIPNPEALFNIPKHSQKNNKNNFFVKEYNTNSKSLTKYLRKMNLCINCKEEIPLTQILCFNCRSKKSTILYQISQELIKTQQKFHKYVSLCNSCQRNHFEEIICQNQECHILYKRIQQENNLNQILNKYQGVFYNDW